MKCPIHTQVNITGGKFTVLGNQDCLLEECAWWDKTHGCCAVLALSRTSRATRDVLGAIAQELTLIRPPRK